MAMYLKKVAVFTIMLQGRWCGDVFLWYIRQKVKELSQGVSEAITSPDTYVFYTILDATIKYNDEDPLIPYNNNSLTSSYNGNSTASNLDSPSHLQMMMREDCRICGLYPQYGVGRSLHLVQCYPFSPLWGRGTGNSSTSHNHNSIS